MKNWPEGKPTRPGAQGNENVLTHSSVHLSLLCSQVAWPSSCQHAHPADRGSACCLSHLQSGFLSTAKSRPRPASKTVGVCSAGNQSPFLPMLTAQTSHPTPARTFCGKPGGEAWEQTRREATSPASDRTWDVPHRRHRCHSHGSCLVRPVLHTCDTGTCWHALLGENTAFVP